ncbi:MAG: hypothetical protein QNL90_00505, partial [Gammaproteobacteria bacterium]|nr:hypothetical protein [Gammaproteobacteria bacterium]MDX2458535.1 hypothetical protein [Gammaproteobacteria bacterium]
AFFFALRLVAFFLTLRLATFFFAARFLAGRFFAAFLRVAFFLLDVFLAAARLVVAFLDVVLRFEDPALRFVDLRRAVAFLAVAILPLPRVFKHNVIKNNVVTITWLRVIANVDHFSRLSRVLQKKVRAEKQMRALSY